MKMARHLGELAKRRLLKEELDLVVRMLEVREVVPILHPGMTLHQDWVMIRCEAKLGAQEVECLVDWAKEEGCEEVVRLLMQVVRH